MGYGLWRKSGTVPKFSAILFLIYHTYITKKKKGEKDMEKLIKYILEEYENNETAGELIRILLNYIDTKEVKTENKEAHIIFNIVVKKEADRLIKQRNKKRNQRKRGNKNVK